MNVLLCVSKQKVEKVARFAAVFLENKRELDVIVSPFSLDCLSLSFPFSCSGQNTCHWFLLKTDSTVQQQESESGLLPHLYFHSFSPLNFVTHPETERSRDSRRRKEPSVRFLSRKKEVCKKRKIKQTSRGSRRESECTDG